MKPRALSSQLTVRVLGALALGAIMLPAAVAGAQQTTDVPAPSSVGNFEFRPFAGALIPTGDQKDILKNSVLTGVELGWQFRPHFALTGAFGWSPVWGKPDNNLNLYQYDLALEGRMSNLMSGSSWSLRPYVRLGAGARTYRYQGLAADGSPTDFVGHGAIGIDLGPKTSNLGVRIEARDNVSKFKGLTDDQTADAVTRNDMQFTAGLTIRM